MKMIEIKNISYQSIRLDNYDKKKKTFCINDLSMSLGDGYITVLLGHNGSGKTTLLKLIYGMLPVKSGEILYNSKTVNKKDMVKYHREVAFVGGNWAVGHMTVRENADFLSVLYQDFDRDYYDELCHTFGLESAMDTMHYKLSSGEAVKAEIAFSLARHPGYLIMDEPLANLDPVAKTEVIDTVQRYVRNENAGLLLSTHLTEEVTDIVDYVAVIEAGKLIKYGDKDTVSSELGTDSLRDVIKNV